MSDENSSAFNKAVEIVASLPKDGPTQPSMEDKLYFYKYFKQATVGDVSTPRPGIFDFQGRAKWDAWNGVKDTEKRTAEELYVQKLIEILKQTEGQEASTYLAELEAA